MAKPARLELNWRFATTEADRRQIVSFRKQVGWGPDKSDLRWQQPDYPLAIFSMPLPLSVVEDGAKAIKAGIGGEETKEVDVGMGGWSLDGEAGMAERATGCVKVSASPHARAQRR